LVATWCLLCCSQHLLEIQIASVQAHASNSRVTVMFNMLILIPDGHSLIHHGNLLEIKVATSLPKRCLDCLLPTTAARSSRMMLLSRILTFVQVLSLMKG